LDYAESIQRQLSDIFWQTGKEVHTRRVRQKMLTILRQIILKVTVRAYAKGSPRYQS
jgi:hypothetical protein